MEIFLLLLRLGLAGVFGVAGIAKIFDPEGSKKAFTDFGVPAPLVRPFAFLLPVFELAVAGTLLFVPSSWFGAIGASALLLIFTAGMLYQMAKGKAPDCHCFGQIHSEPVGVSSIVRNLVIMAPAVILVIQGRSRQGLEIIKTDQDILFTAVGLAVIVLLLAAVMYLKSVSEQQKQIMRRIELMELIGRDTVDVEREDIGHPREGLPLGALVPDFELPDLDGKTVTLKDIKADKKPVVFFFVAPTCTPCRALLPQFEEWQRDLADKVKFVFISNRAAKDNRAKFGGDREKTILLQKDREVAELFRAKWTPMAVLMDTKGRIASFTGAGDLGLRELMEKVGEERVIDEFTYLTGSNEHRHAPLMIGETVPEISVTDINGNGFDSSQFKGKETLVAFWSPTCKYCEAMMDDIKEWDKTRNGTEPNLVIFADGEKEEHLKLGLKAPMIVDSDREIGETFGQFGTPSAILVDENGKFISETAIGAEDIWSLIGKRK
ncbi:MAG: redoxin domain-containing protein [Pyrinomonadaceae bacterium]|nr:redoxin domain-containing protein [Pyrinomonadaceae bacterium]